MKKESVPTQQMTKSNPNRRDRHHVGRRFMFAGWFPSWAITSDNIGKWESIGWQSWEILSWNRSRQNYQNAFGACNKRAEQYCIDTLTEQELIELNHKIVERLKFLESMRAHNEMITFNIGETVSFSPPGRGELTGILVKYNQKTVTILTEDGQKWNVSPHLLKRVEKRRRRVKRSGNVISMPPKK